MKRKPEFENVMFRLKKALDISNDKELCARLALRPSAFSNRKSTHSIPYENVLDLAGLENLNLNWIFWGEGEPKSATNINDLPIDIEGALIDENLFGIISLRIEQEFNLNEGDAEAFFSKILDFRAKNDMKNPDVETREALSTLLEEERKRHESEVLEKAAMAASLYNEVVQRKLGKDFNSIKKFLDEGVRMYINFLKLIRSKT